MVDERYRPDIDGLRTVAVMGVFFFHLGLPFISGGFVGVDVFFVISGFLITRLIKDEAEAGDFRFLNFYVRRVRRLLPAALATIALSLIFGFLLLSQDHFKALCAAAVASVFSVSNILFWQESGYFDTLASVKPLLHTWSLGVEEQFYLVWPAALVFLLSARSRLVAPVTLVVAGATWLYFSWAWIDRDPSAPFYLSQFRIPEFAVGSLMVWGVSYRSRSGWWPEVILFIGLATILASMHGFSDLTPFPSFYAMLPCIGAAMAIYGGTAPRIGVVLRNRPMVWIGERSYSLYLVHWPVIVFYGYYRFAPFTVLDQLKVVLATFAIGWALHRLVEVPFRRSRDTTPVLTNPAFAAVFASLAILIVAPAATAWEQGGWGWRIPAPGLTQSMVNQQLDMRISDWAKSIETINTKSQDVGSFAPNARLALIIGDSHTAHLRGAFDYLGKTYNLRVTLWYYVGCNPLFGTTHIFPVPDPREAGCAEQNRTWESFIKTHRYDYIVLASRWAYTVEPPKYGPFRVPQHYIVDVLHPEPTLEASQKVLVSHLHSTVEAILATGAETIVVAQTPNSGKSLDGCDDVPRYLISDKAIEERCLSIDKSLALARQKFVNDTFRAEAAKDSRVHAIIPTDYFCDTPYPRCRTLYDGIRLFQDETHLTVAGAKYLALRWEQSPDFPFHRPPGYVAAGSPAPAPTL